MTGPLEEEIGLPGRVAEEAEVKLAGGGAFLAVAIEGFVKEEAGTLLAGEEECDVADRERVEETLADTAEGAVEIHLGAEFTGEDDEGAAVIVAVAIKDVAVQLLLDPITERLEDERGDEDEQDHGGGAEFVETPTATFAPGEREQEDIDDAQD
jgi:hypothetical protein